jgi:hypothetical protein
MSYYRDVAIRMARDAVTGDAYDACPNRVSVVRGFTLCTGKHQMIQKSGLWYHSFSSHAATGTVRRPSHQPCRFYSLRCERPSKPIFWDAQAPGNVLGCVLVLSPASGSLLQFSADNQV